MPIGGSQVWPHRIFLLSALGVLELGVPPPAGAQTQQQIDQCLNGSAPSIEEQIDSCTAMIRSGRYTGDTLVSALSRRGTAYVAAREFDMALADFEQALRIDPRSAHVIHARGTAYAQKNDCDRAIADYNEALRLTPNEKTIYANRSRCWRAKDEIDKALGDLNRALQIDPQYAYAYRERGVLLFSKGDFRGAIDNLQRSVESAYSALYLYLARSRLGEAATAQLEQNAKSLRPADWPYPIVELYLGRRSIADAAAAAKYPNDRCEADFYVGQWLILQGDMADARVRLEAAKRSCPKSFGEYIVAVGELARLGR